jgi:hypothetical protein
MTSAVRFADPERGAIDDIVDLDRYPIDQPGSPAQQAIVDQCRAALAEDGCCTLPGFLRSDALAQARAEIAALTPKASVREEFCSVYVRGDSEAALPEGDPRGRVMRRLVGHVTRDQIPPDAIAQRLYVAPAVKAFVAACVDEQRIYEYADPLAALIATVLPPGGQLPWHYDTNEFVVTVVTQEPEGGGLFQYHQNLRRPGDENIDGLRRVLDEQAPDTLRTRQLRAGDMQLFLGRYSIHRVTTVEGERERHVAVLSYANRPGVIGPLDRTRGVYGRVTEAHLVAHELTQSADGLIL